MADKKERYLKKVISAIASVFLLFLVLTAAQCPEEGLAGIGGGENPPIILTENSLLLEPTVDGIAMSYGGGGSYFNRYTDQYFVVGSDDTGGWPYDPSCCGDPLYFVTLLRFDQAEIDQKDVQQAYLYLFGYDVGVEGSSLSENLQVDRIAGEWDIATHFWDDAILPGFVTPGDTVELPAPIDPGVAGTAYAIDVTAIVQDWATSDGNYGFRLMANQDPADQKRVRFRSSEYLGEETEKPYLAIEYLE